MIEDNFILREPLLDPKQRVIGFQFSWQQADSNAQVDSQNLDYLLEFVAGHLNDDDGFLLADSLVFLEALPEV